VALKIVELFGHQPLDPSSVARELRQHNRCPFIGSTCTKRFRDGTVSGVCSVQPVQADYPVICCPNRLYAGDYRILRDVASYAFGSGIRLIDGAEVGKAKHDGRNVAVFGKRWGKELRLPQRERQGAYFVDWVLALIAPTGSLQEFVAVEVQSIDTTGNYREEWESYKAGRPFEKSSPSGLNWENVSKRILPQIIYKGHVLGREPLCTKGLFFVTPQQVYERIQGRLAHAMLDYPGGPAAGRVTFMWYWPAPPPGPGLVRDLNPGGRFTTEVQQVALAFTAPRDLPSPGTYEKAIRAQLAAVSTLDAVKRADPEMAAMISATRRVKGGTKREDAVTAAAKEYGLDPSRLTELSDLIEIMLEDDKTRG
jgi:hypothetical protein